MSKTITITYLSDADAKALAASIQPLLPFGANMATTDDDFALREAGARDALLDGAKMCAGLALAGGITAEQTALLTHASAHAFGVAHRTG